MATRSIATFQPASTPTQTEKSKDGKGWPERGITLEYDFKEEKMIDNWGEDVIRYHFVKQAIILLQNKVRRMLKEGVSDEDVKKMLAEHKPAIPASTRKSPGEKMADLFKNMSKEQKVEAMKQLRETAGV